MLFHDFSLFQVLADIKRVSYFLLPTHRNKISIVFHSLAGSSKPALRWGQQEWNGAGVYRTTFSSWPVCTPCTSKPNQFLATHRAPCAHGLEIYQGLPMTCYRCYPWRGNRIVWPFFECKWWREPHSPLSLLQTATWETPLSPVWR